MLNSMKYSMIMALRNKEFMFSSILVAVLMGTVMFFMTGTILDEVAEGTFEIPVAVVEIPGHEHGIFIEIIEEIEMFDLEFLDSEEALYQLETGEIEGIFEVGDEPRLLVTMANFSQLVLQTVVDEYVMGSDIIMNIASANPQYLEAAIMSMTDRESVMVEMEKAENITDMMQMFAIMFVTSGAFSGVFVGFERAVLMNNDGAIGSRRLVSSFGKMRLLVMDLVGVSLVVVLISFIIWAYYTIILNVALEINLALAGISFFLTALFSVAFGAFFGLVAPGKRKTREQILNGVFMIFIMLAFFGVNVRTPLIQTLNAYNPITLLLDALMALNIGSYTRYVGFMVILAVSAVGLLAATLIVLRRNRNVDAK